MTVSIDLNADLGELPGDAGRASDRAILEHVTSCAIACGGHAGDFETMAATLRAAEVHDVAVGAHPSYPDTEGFGRRSLTMPRDALQASLVSQLTTLRDLATELGTPLFHVKPHGALYNDASKDGAIANVIVLAVEAVFGHSVAIICQPGFALSQVAGDAGMSVYGEAFIDRAYRADGTLVPRGAEGAVLQSETERLEQATDIALRRRVKLSTGGGLPLHAQTLCIHGDSPGAAETAAAVRRALEGEGVLVRAPKRL
ncbi:MAG: 5-oxoprolinase subunit PxpA [Pseudomonadota bacterium]